MQSIVNNISALLMIASQVIVTACLILAIFNPYQEFKYAFTQNEVKLAYVFLGLSLVSTLYTGATRLTKARNPTSKTLYLRIGNNVEKIEELPAKLNYVKINGKPLAIGEREKDVLPDYERKIMLKKLREKNDR